MAHAQKPDFVFLRNGRVHLNRWGRQFSRLLAAEVCISSSNAEYITFGDGVRVLATHSIRQFPRHFPSRASPWATRFRTSSTSRVTLYSLQYRNSLVCERRLVFFESFQASPVYPSDKISLKKDEYGPLAGRY